jgi:hypothetical protein
MSLSPHKGILEEQILSPCTQDYKDLCFVIFPIPRIALPPSLIVLTNLIGLDTFFVLSENISVKYETNFYTSDSPRGRGIQRNRDVAGLRGAFQELIKGSLYG